VQLISHATLKKASRGENNFLASQEIPRTSLKPKVQYRILNIMPPVPILSQIIPGHALQFHISKNIFNIILLYTPGCYKLLQVSPQKSCVHFSSPLYMPH